MSEKEARGHRIDLAAVGHAYGPVTALSTIDLVIAPGELVALLGPSGCGKTTLLRIIAGFVFPTSGTVSIAGADVTRMPPGQRNVGIVFQNYALFPHMTVERNVGYGLKARHVERDQCAARVKEMLDLVKMADFAQRYPGELSGGQQQRIALARALAVRPRIMLLDEPFSALDRGLRLDMQMEVKSLLKSYGVTSILVTHDQEEALSMADRIIVLHDGKVEQVGSASDLYDRPATLFVNRFLGQTNLLPGTVTGRNEALVSVRLDCGAAIDIPCPGQWGQGQPVLLSVRPENLHIAQAPGARTISAVVGHFAPLGAVDMIEAVAACGTQLKIARPHRLGEGRIANGQTVPVEIAIPQACSLFSLSSSAAQNGDAQTGH